MASWDQTNEARPPHACNELEQVEGFPQRGESRSILVQHRSGEGVGEQDDGIPVLRWASLADGWFNMRT